jgi:hypothetical protein
MAKLNDDWFCQLLTVEDTDVISPEQIERLRREGRDEEIIQQEYYCSFKASIQGAYYCKQLELAEKEERITRVPVSHHPVETWWDIGVSDYTTIWFVQYVGGEVRLIDYYQNSGFGVDHYVDVLMKKAYRYGAMNLPHDANNRQFTTRGAKSPYQMFKDMLPEADWKVHPRTNSVIDDINAARMMMDKCVWDFKNTKDGINALKSYTKEFDDKKQMFRDKPLHNWASHGADGFRYMAVNWYFRNHKKIPRDPATPMTFNDVLYGGVEETTVERY